VTLKVEKVCGHCLRFERFTTPGIEHFGKCRIQNTQVSEGDKACENHAKEVEIRYGSEGWRFVCGRDTAGPFKNFSEADPVAVAEQLCVKPKQVFLAKLNVLSITRSEEEVPTLKEAAAEVGDTFSYQGDQPFYGRIQLTALGFPQSRYMKLTFHCGAAKEDCPPCELATQQVLEFDSAEMDPSAFATYFDTNIPRDALRILVERGLQVGCPAWWKRVVAVGEDERAVTQCVVLDRKGTEGRAWLVHSSQCDLRRAPNWVITQGWLCRGRMGRIGVLVYALRPESEVMSPKPREVKRSMNILRERASSDDLKGSGVWKIAEALQRRSQLKGSEVIKGFASDLITVAGPTWVKTLEGPRQLGPTTIEMGPTTTAKSLRIRMLIEWLGSGKYDTGRKTVAGLTAGAEKVEGMGWIIRKGLLPSMDLSWLVIDNMPPHALDEQIEARRNGVVIITAIRGAELWARSRLKLLSNPKTPFDETMYKCTALKVYDSKLIARFTFAVFTYGVSTEERYKSKIIKPLSTDEELLDATKKVLTWNLSREATYAIPVELWSLIMNYGRELEEKYGCEDIPLLLRANPYKLAVVAYSFALLEGFEEPTAKHVKLAYEWLDFCAQDIELDKYVEWWRAQHILTEEEYESLAKKLEQQITEDLNEHGGTREETTVFQIITYLAKNESAQRDEIAAYADVDPKTISRKVRILKGLGLLRSSKEGYHFTAKGVRFFRRWFGANRVPDVPHVSTSEGQRHIDSLFQHGEECKVGVTPKSGDIKGIGDSSPSVQEAIEYAFSQMAKRKPDNTTGDMFIHDLRFKLGSKKEAEKLLDRLLDEGLLAYDKDGWLVKV